MVGLMLNNDQRSTLRHNLDDIQDRIRSAANRADRNAGSIRLLAVTKYVDASIVAALVEAGVTDIGESRVQDALAKAADPSLGSGVGDGVRWHLIGHLQRNKARHAAELFGVLHSLDSLDLARRLSSQAEQYPDNPGCREVFIEVQLSPEAAKSGVRPSDLPTFAQSLETLEAGGQLRLQGLMAIPPAGGTERSTRTRFAELRQLLETLNRNRERRGLAALNRLSMGMSADFEIAIEEGATDVRIGSALYSGLLVSGGAR